MEASTMQSLTATGRAPATTVNKATVWMVKHKRAKSKVGLLQNHDIATAVLHNISHGTLMTAESAYPLLWFNRILFFLGPKELADGIQPVVPQLQPVLGDLPSVDVGERWGDDGEPVV